MNDKNFDWITSQLSHSGNVRTYNEDACMTRSDIPLWAVADGMGGHEAGDVASAKITGALNEMQSALQLNDYVDKIDDTLILVNSQLRDLGRDKYNNRTIGSTVVCMVANRNYIAYLWVGDSRLYRIRDHKITQLTKDHSEVQNLVDQGLLRAEDAESHPSANVITRAIGASDDLYLSVGVDETQDNDIYILCSDGLYRDMTEVELLNICDECDLQPEEITNKLMQTALSREAKDNITMVVTKSILNRESI